MTQEFAEYSQKTVKTDDTEQLISHSEGVKPMEIAFQYLKEHQNA